MSNEELRIMKSCPFSFGNNSDFFGILHFEAKVVDTFIGTKDCKLQKMLIAS